MSDLFFYGTLCVPEIQEVVLGRSHGCVRAVLDGHDIVEASADGAFPMLIESPGAQAQGCVMRDLTETEILRLYYFAAGFAASPREVSVRQICPDTGAETLHQVVTFLPDPARLRPGGPWRREAWAPRWAATVTEAVRDFMALQGRVSAAVAARRWPQMLVRAGARVRARQSMPTQLRRQAQPGDLQRSDFRQPYANFFAVEEEDIAWRRFDGAMGAPMTRACFISADAVVVLPYDPLADRVMLVEQFRMGPYARGDSQPWQLEAVAGRIDGGETPEEAALRETREEAHLALDRLIAGPSCYASPGAKTEYLYHFVGLAQLPDSAAVTAGLAEEGEDIRAHVIGFDAMMALIETGEIDNAPLILLAFWLAGRREALRREALADLGARAAE